MSCLGIPFSWEKFGGGLQYEWIGFEAGLAEKRRIWLVKWLQEVLDKRVVLVRHFADVLGRIQYAALALQFLRPFLGPLYAWSCAVPGGACIPLPGAIRPYFHVEAPKRRPSHGSLQGCERWTET